MIRSFTSGVVTVKFVFSVTDIGLWEFYFKWKTIKSPNFPDLNPLINHSEAVSGTQKSKLIFRKVTILAERQLKSVLPTFETFCDQVLLSQLTS